MRVPSFPAKQRDDFALVGSCKLPAGSWTARCQAQRADGTGTRWTLAVILGVAVDGETPMSIDAGHTVTTDWPPGPLVADVMFSDSVSGIVVHTSKFVIAVEGTVTRP